MSTTDFTNCYEDETRAAAYATLEFGGTYHLAFRDLPVLFAEHTQGNKAVDFGCGTGRSTQLLRRCGFEATGIDISGQMVARAKEVDPAGDYRVMAPGDFTLLESGLYDLVLSAFTFDNVAGEQKTGLFRGLRGLLSPGGRIVSVVSSPEIYFHEWASFSTRDFPENREKKSGDLVRIITTDFADARPIEDILCTDETYLDIYRAAGLRVLRREAPLATGEEPYAWVTETQIAPWVIWVLERAE